MPVTTSYEIEAFEPSSQPIVDGQDTLDVLNLTGMANGCYALIALQPDGGGGQQPVVNFYGTDGSLSASAALTGMGDLTKTQALQISELSNGTVLIAWDNHDASGGSVRGHIFNADGTQVSTSELDLSGSIEVDGNGVAKSENQSSDFHFPEITALVNGGFVTSYTDMDTGNAIVRIFDNFGTDQFGEILTEDLVRGQQVIESIIALSDGGFAVAFTHNVGDGEIYTRTFDADGTARSASQILVDGSGVNTAPAITALGNGQYALVYSDTDMTGEDATSGIKLVYFDNDGSQMGAPMAVNTASNLSEEINPEIAVLDNGFLLITWTRLETDGSGHIIGTILDEAGNTVMVGGNPEFVVSNNADAGSITALAALVNGAFVTAWGDESGGLEHGTMQLARSMNGDATDDIINGDDLRDKIYGQDGDDVLTGEAGNDELYGQNGQDDLAGGAGDDWLNGGENIDNVSGGDGADIIFGGTGADIIFGDAGDDDISGGLGEDNISGGFGNDLISGGSQNDDINGNAGDDALNGNAGNDNLRGETGADILNGGGGDDMLFGNEDNDSLFGSTGNDLLLGGQGDDQLSGGNSQDNLFGGEGIDTLLGGAGHDSLFGEAGNDTLDGGSGMDTLVGGQGDDVMTGGLGTDSFVFTDGFGQDTITDFTNNADSLDFSGLSDFNSFADVMAVAEQVRGNVEIVLDRGNSLILEDFDIAQLDATDFIF